MELKNNNTKSDFDLLDQENGLVLYFLFHML